MTKLGPQEAIEPIVKLGADKLPARLQTVTQVLTVLSLLFVVMTPVTYFNGRAFHDGWYAYLHLDQQMFPLDTAGMLTQGAVAWGDALAELVNASIKGVMSHWFVLLLMALCGALVWTAFAWINRKMDEGKSGRRERPIKQRGRFAKVVRPIWGRVLVLAIVMALACEVISLLTLGFGVLTVPFYQLGRYEAKKAVATNFEKAPVVSVKSAKGEMLELREIGCGPNFCAVWGNGHASTAPLSAIAWSDSPPPDK